MQDKLFYEGIGDGGFGERTLRAVLKYQTATFGPSSDDGIVLGNGPAERFVTRTMVFLMHAAVAAVLLSNSREATAAAAYPA